jgi:hypothetical protein
MSEKNNEKEKRKEKLNVNKNKRAKLGYDICHTQEHS